MADPVLARSRVGVQRPTPAAPSAAVADVADTFVGLMRSFVHARARMLAAAEHDVEWSAHILLRIVKTEGPLRAGAVAECMHADPSTVSRQVAALVRDGLLERRADQQDGRASLLALTARGEDVLADHNRTRLGYFAHMLSDWDENELAHFAGLLHRFADDYAAVDDNWIKERIVPTSAHALHNPGSTTS